MDDFTAPSTTKTPQQETDDDKGESQQQTTMADRPIQRKRGSKFIEMSEKRESRLLELNEQRGSKLFETLDRKQKKDDLSNEGILSSNLTCDNEHIDIVLVQHLMYIEYLLSVSIRNCIHC